MAKQILRAHWHDYKDTGYYMITMVTEARVRAFGTLVGNSEESANVELSPLGKVLEKEIKDQSKRHPEIKIEDYIILEDHCHILVHVHTTMPDHLGKVVWGIKYGTTAAYLNALNAIDGNVHKVEGTRLPEKERNKDKRAANQHGNTTPNPEHANARKHTNVQSGVSALKVHNTEASVVLVPPLWQKGYNDRIISSYSQLSRTITYIHRNPSRLWLKRHTDRSLTRVNTIRLPIAFELAKQLKDFALYWDQRRSVTHSAFSHRHDDTHYAETYEELTQKFLRINPAINQPFLKLKLCGNGNLLVSGRPLIRVRISRSVTQQQFESEVNRILDLCEHEGAIPISPFRSWSEKAVLRILRMNGYDHIILYGEAMWDGWKPQDSSSAEHHQTLPPWFLQNYPEVLSSTQDPGDLIETYSSRCAFLAPWHDRPKGEKATKPDCELMNEICAILQSEISQNSTCLSK